MTPQYALISNYKELYFLEASYNPFQSLHIDHIGPLRPNDKGNTLILVMIDTFSRWVEHLPALRSIRNTRRHTL